METIRGPFANALRPFKGGTAGVAEIRRFGASGPVASVPPEYIAVHWQELSTEDGAELDVDLGGRPGFQVFFDGVPTEAIDRNDVLIFGGYEVQVRRVELRSNNGPITSALCAIRGDA
jgi:hypothetical protein